MPDLEELHLDDFKPHVKSRFHLDPGAEDEGEESGGGFEVELVEAEEMPTRQKIEQGRRRPFSLLFRAPHDRPLDQRAYELTHPDLGRQWIFLVPVNEDDDGRYYEAVFT